MTFPLRRSARLQQSDNCKARTGARQRRPLSPSPSTSGSFREPRRQRRQGRGKLDTHPTPTQAQIGPEHCGLSQRPPKHRLEEASGPPHRQKRRKTGTCTINNPVEQPAFESVATQTETSLVDEIREASPGCNFTARDDRYPITHWASTGLWPENYATMAPKQSNSSQKHSRGSSYSQEVRDGKAPRPHTAASEINLAEHDIIMEELKGDEFVSEASKKLYTTMLLSRYEDPVYTQFPLSKFLLLWDRLRIRNEYRVARDITPLLVPSPELLFFCGHQDLEHIAEEVSADFTKSDPMGGSKPRPDFAVGVARSAFTDDEIAKLKNCTSWERATLFTDHMYFPFLLCEAKSNREVVDRADRQNMRSSSMAVNAIIQLHQDLGADQRKKLSGQILVFSVSHTNDQVKIYGHFAIIEGAKVTFYRCRIAAFFLGPGEGARNWKKTYNFVREIYHKFYPGHLKRIQRALAEMADPQISSRMSIDESESQELDSSVLSSKQDTIFKKPINPASKKRKGEMAVLEERIAQQEKQHQEYKDQQEKQMAQQEKQMAQQEKQYQEYKDQQEKQMAQQEKQMAQQEKQMAQQEKQHQEYKDQQEKQMAQQEKQMAEQSEMLKRLLNRP